MIKNIPKVGSPVWASDSAGVAGLIIVLLANIIIAVLAVLTAGTDQGGAVIAFGVGLVGTALLVGLSLGVASLRRGYKWIGILVILLAVSPFPVFLIVLHVTAAMLGIHYK